MQEMQVRSLSREDSLMKEMASNFLENPMDKDAWWTTVNGVAKSNTTQPLSMHAHFWVSEKTTGATLGLFFIRGKETI